MKIEKFNDEELDDYGRFYYSIYDDKEFPLVKAFKDKGYSEDVLHDIKRISLFIDAMETQRIIYNGDD
jgi:hypothetical protein